MKNPNKIAILCSILLMGCASEKNIQNNVKTIAIDVSTASERLDPPLIDTTTFSIVPLETTSECLIGEVTRVFLKKDKIYVYDKISKGMYIFDKEGSYLSKVHSVGAGPMEYIDASDIFVSDEDITVIDNYGRKILVYDMDGNYLRHFPMDKKYFANMVLKIGDRIYYANLGSKTELGTYILFSTDTKGADIKSYIPFDKEVKYHISLPYCYSMYSAQAKLMVSSVDTIYKIDKYGVRPEYVLDFMGKKLPEEYKKDNIIELTKKGLRHTYVLSTTTISESEKYLFLKFTYNKEPYIVIYNKLNGKTKLTKNIGVKNIAVSGNINFIQDNKLVGYDGANSLIHLWKSTAEKRKDVSNFHSQLYKVIEKMGVDDNPVLFIYDLK